MTIKYHTVKISIPRNLWEGLDEWGNDDHVFIFRVYGAKSDEEAKDIAIKNLSIEVRAEVDR